MQLLLLLKLHLSSLNRLHAAADGLLERIQGHVFRLYVFTLMLNNEALGNIAVLIGEGALLRHFLRKFTFLRRLLIIQINIVHVLVRVGALLENAHGLLHLQECILLFDLRVEVNLLWLLLLLLRRILAADDSRYLLCNLLLLDAGLSQEF